MDNELEKELLEEAREWYKTRVHKAEWAEDYKFRDLADFASTYSKREKEANRLLGIAVKERDRFDKELDIVHRCLTDLYGDETQERIRKCLDEIEALSQMHPQQGENDGRS